MKVVLIHGIAQGGKDPAELKRAWVSTLNEGLAANNLQLPDDTEFVFPYYGDILNHHVEQAKMGSAESITQKGPQDRDDFERFLNMALLEVQKIAVISDDEVAELLPSDESAKGPQNWGWVQALARTIDKRFKKVTEYTIERFLKEVYLYLYADDVTADVNNIVAELLTDEPTLVIGHSLGSVVGYRINERFADRMQLDKYITVGSPLGLRVIAAKLKKPANLAKRGWYNAYDERDIVALNPLDNDHFPTMPAITNNNTVKNKTDNRHGIIGYLNDPNVARMIHESIV